MRQLSLEEYKQRVLGVLIKIDAICREQGFAYWIFYGTLLGAVRHGGFIPWDDDVDIVMPREDYYKLGKYIQEHPEHGVNYIDVSNRPDTIYYCAKVCDTSTVLRESVFRPLEGYGAFVDIFPLDNLPDGEEERLRYYKKALRMEQIVQHGSRLRPFKGDSRKETLLRWAAFLYAHLYDPGRMIGKMHQLFMENNKTPTRYVGVPWSDQLFRRELFEEKTELVFEGHRFFAPKNWDEALRASYGDYMQLPEESKRVCSHGLVCYEKD